MMWDAEICKDIFKDIEIGVLDFSHRLRVLWSLFDEKSASGKLILKKLEVEINKVTYGKGLLTHNHMVVSDHMVDTVKLWDTAKTVLSQMVVKLVEMLATDQIHRLACQPKESDLCF